MHIPRKLVGALASLPLALSLGALTAGTATAEEVTVNIARVKAIDPPDAFSKGDFYARVTIDGETQKTEVVKHSVDIKPNWKITKKVKPGVIKVKVEILDKDISQDDPIDINRVDGKRDLDFTVDTGSCQIVGFSEPYKCGKSITRVGKEKKAAGITMLVGVKK
jgi:hypothetical protein